MGTREHNPVSSSNRIREIKRDLDFTTKMVGMQGTDRLSHGTTMVVQESIRSGAPLYIPSPTEYIRSTRIKENMAGGRLGIDLKGIGRQDDSLTDGPTEAQVRAFEDLTHK